MHLLGVTRLGSHDEQFSAPQKDEKGNACEVEE